MKNLKIKKCNKCGALFEVIEDCTCQNCKLICCGEEMKDVISSSVEASHEKHIPTFEIEGNNINITVNHVMEEDHFIEWIKVITENDILHELVDSIEEKIDIITIIDLELKNIELNKEIYIEEITSDFKVLTKANRQ